MDKILTRSPVHIISYDWQSDLGVLITEMKYCTKILLVLHAYIDPLKTLPCFDSCT